jgi:hypothetical protein
MEVTFRPGTVDDAKACGAICYEAFKVIAEEHRFPLDFPSADVAVGLLTMVLSRKDVYSVVAERDRRVIRQQLSLGGGHDCRRGTDYGASCCAERFHQGAN